MATENTSRVSFRLKTDFYDHLPPERQKDLDNMDTLYTAAQHKAREVFDAGALTST